jgi:trimethylamine--corrinoid protein Co-methyltransferase
MKPQIAAVLSDGEVGRIHAASVEILERTGVLVQSEELAALLAQGGARVQPAGTEQGSSAGGISAGDRVVRFPAGLTERLVGRAPPTFRLYSRNGAPPMEVGLGVTRSVAGFDAPFFQDLDTGVRRPIRKADVANFARLADGLAEVDIVGNQGVPQDVPPGTEEAHAVAALLENTGKHLLVAPDTGPAARAIYRMMEAATGTGDLGARPAVCCHISPTSPLRWTPKACQIILETVPRGVPFLILPAPMAGATSPVTLAGHLTVHNTEILSGYLIAQILRGGHPVAYCNAHTLFNLREGDPLIATPETLLLRIAGAQMARFYRIPCHSIGFDTDAHLHDEQCAWEKALTALVGVQAGMDFLVNLGMFSTGLTVSYAQLLLDAELFGLLKRFARGIEAGEEQVARDLIERVGSWGAYLEEEHTLLHFRAENWYPELSCRKRFDPWQEAGSPDVVHTAREKAQAMLSREPKPYLDARRKSELERIIARELG